MTAQINFLVRLYGLFTEATRKTELKITTSDPLDVRTLLEILKENLGSEFGSLLMYEDQSLREDVILLLNNKILGLSDLDTKLSIGDELSLIKAISGG